MEIINDVVKIGSIPKITTKNKPYFENLDIKIYNQDILKFSALSENSVDLIVTSPPYNLDIS